MRKAITTIVFISLSMFAFSQTAEKESKKIATFCKIWGYLKYYHPSVAKGKFDWDKEFTSRVRSLAALNSKQDISNYYSEWIKSLGEIKTCKKCNEQIPDSLKFNLDLDWLNDTALFTNILIEQLQYIHNNRNQSRNFYVKSNLLVGNTSYNNEKEYRDSIYPSPNLRLLSLSRYWNIINYFCPYKYRTDQSWEDVLTEMIPKFRDAEDTVRYHLAMLELTAKIDDSHAHLITKYTNDFFGLKWAPFKFLIIDNKAIVSGFYNDSLCIKNDIQQGDVFLNVDDVSIENIIKEKSRYLGASNDPAKLYNLFYVIFNGQTDSVKVTYERNGATTEKYLYRYSLREFKYKGKESEKPVYSILDENIGYINLGLLKRKQVKDALNELRNTKAIIFDVRNYPNGTMYKISKFLNSERTPFAKFTIPDLSYPGVFEFTKPYYCGSKNNTPYGGMVALLFNEKTISHAEFTLMALQTAPNVVSIGSQTAGADGNVSTITFPGNYKTYMTGIGVYYPDGRETQRIGIIPDIEVKPTIEGIRLKKDEVLEKAIQVINEKCGTKL